MKYLLTSFFGLMILSSNAQNSRVIVYTEEGENFTLFINGKKFNEEPASRVTATGIDVEFGQIKIEFDIPGAPILKSPLMIDKSSSYTTVVKKNNKGKYVLRMVSRDAYEEEPERVKIVETQPDQPTQSQTQPSQPQTTQTTTTTTSDGEEESESIGFNVSMGGESVSMNINLGGMDVQGETTTTTTTTSTTQSPGSSGNSSQQLSANVEGNNILLSDGRVFTWKYVDLRTAGIKVEMLNPVGAKVSISYDGREAYSSEVPFEFDGGWKNTNSYFKLDVAEPTGNWSVKLKNRNGNKILIDGASSLSPTPSQPVQQSNACSNMSSENFNRAKVSIEGKAFADEKMTVFKQVIRNNCVSVSQVIGFMGLFTYEEEKLDVAKLSYPQATNKGDYYQVNDALTYSDSIEELEDFLENQ